MARLVWHADLDPAVVAVRAEPVAPGDPDAFDIDRFAPMATLVVTAAGHEHLVLSDGWRRVRLDIVQGSLNGARPVRLRYLISGLTGAEAHLLTIQRLLGLSRHGRFVRGLFPAEPGIDRRIEALRVGDALSAGASYREAAIALYGEDRVQVEWKAQSDFLLSRVRRRALEAQQMAGGGWRTLLQH